MWTDFDEPSHTILAEAAVARERARSKKRRKQPPRSKRKSIGASHTTFNKPTCGEPTFVIASNPPTASMAQVDSVPLDLGTSRNEQPEAPQVPSLQVASIIGEPDSHAAPTRSSQLEQCETAEVGVVAIPPEPAETISYEEINGLPASTSVPSVRAAIELQSAKRPPHPLASKRVGLAVMGSLGLFGALWLLNANPNREAEAITADRAPVPVRVWTDAAPLEQVQTVAEVPLITPQPEQDVVVASTDAAAIQKAPLDEVPFADRPKDHQLVEATSIGSVSLPREVAKSIPVALVPLPPRRPVSLLVRHTPVAHPVAAAATMIVPDRAKPPVEQAERPEAYASFSARSHEIGTHKLPWGMARLHEDANSDSGRGAVWDFVPIEP